MIERCTAHDHMMFNCRPTINPRKADFMAKVMPLLSTLDETLFGADWVLVNKLSISKYWVLVNKLSISNCLMGALFISRICDQFLVFVIYNFPRYCDK